MWLVVVKEVDVRVDKYTLTSYRLFPPNKNGQVTILKVVCGTVIMIINFFTF